MWRADRCQSDLGNDTRRTSRHPLRVRLACAALAVGVPSLSQGTVSSQVQVAFSEISRLVPSMTCKAPEIWTVPGDEESAARFLVAKLEERDWKVMEHGTTAHSYAVIADPDPVDPKAVAVGGLLLQPPSATSSVAFLAVCSVERANPRGFPGGVYTRIDGTSRAT